MSGPFLKRLDLALLRNRSAADYTQVPYALAIVDLYREGATVTVGTTIPSGFGTLVAVYAPGALTAGDTVMVGVAGASLAVTSIADATHVWLGNSSGASVTLNVGDRLIPTGSRPTAFLDPFGTSSLGSSIAADAAGRAVGYIDQRWFDYTVSPGRVAFDATSTSTFTGTGSTMSWTHTVGGPDRRRQPRTVRRGWQRPEVESPPNPGNSNGDDQTSLSPI